MRRSGSISLGMPSFSGATRQLILINVVVFFALALLDWLVPAVGLPLNMHLLLQPVALFHGEIWQLVTYSFLPMGILSSLFAMISLWFTGVYLEDIYGSRWLLEFYLLTAAAGGLLAAVLSYTHLFRIGPGMAALGAWPPILALLVAFSFLGGDQIIRFNFLFNIKAKYLAALYLLVYLAILVKGDDRFGALTALTTALVGWLYVKTVPRRGLTSGMTESMYGARNGYYRWKRRRAARKFEVYMRKQNREVRFDDEGRYIDPDSSEREQHRKLNDKRWMN